MLYNLGSLIIKLSGHGILIITTQFLILNEIFILIPIYNNWRHWKN